MADIKGESVESTGVVVNALGVCTYLINGKTSTRDDFTALNVARIAASLEVLANGVLEAAADDDGESGEGDDDGGDDDEGDEPDRPKKKNLFGL